MTDTAAPPRPAARARRRKRLTRLTSRDKLVLGVLIGIPTLLHIALIWVPTIGSVILSFGTLGPLDNITDMKWVGLQNYEQIFTIYPLFWPAVEHNVIWLVFFLLVPTTLGLLLAYVLDKELKGTRIYQSLIFVPVVLSLALVGFIWELIYNQDGLLNAVLGTDRAWLSSDGNLYLVLIAASWRHVGYVMILFLAGLKSVDPALREAASLDGASEWQTFRHVVFPALAPVNVVVLVVTIVESLRAFDIVYVLNGGRNGLELLSVLVTQNVIGEASRPGYGSALAVILLAISMVVILPYLYKVFRKDLTQ
ncbi:carbohydrate ABC transporter permease [Nocardioides mesophilus]|uniref:Sugar ABC transporter permease n=1 Tax=Nocardioides mesophilus TaxID=433659 RepID=A0A7G9RDF2_9ACTN|nr:sugar ABC transporter permease [Nocardioides mesophilus]QNN53627.1 sugar ABC transporter permease [Nocardioides mesophilus]